MISSFLLIPNDIAQKSSHDFEKSYDILSVTEKSNKIFSYLDM